MACDSDKKWGKVNAMAMDTTRSIFLSARKFFAGTLLSRSSGLFREIAMAFCFGSTPAVAAFMVAYRLANLFRRLFGEGNLQSGFVPYFEALYGKSPKLAFEFYRDVSFSLAFLLVGITLGVEGVLFFLGNRADEGWKEIAHLAMWMAPGLFFVCLYGLNAALLQCKKRYFLPAAAPAVFNLVWIVFAFSVSTMSQLAMGITAAFAFQWLLTSFQVRKEIFVHLSWKEWMQPQIFSDSWKLLMKPLSLGIVGVGAMQVNSALDAIFARIADLSGPAYLWYAMRVQQLPLALFGIALSGALLPPLARAIQGGEIERYKELLKGALTQAATLMIPCTFALFALGKSGLQLLYQHGKFTEGNLNETLHCLWGYGVGLLPAVFVLLLAGGFYARKVYAIPVIASLCAVALNIALNLFFVFSLKWGAVSIAISTSLSSFLNALILYHYLRKEIGSIQLFSQMAKLLVCSAIATVVVIGIGGHFFLQAPLYAVGVYGLARMFKMELLKMN